ncbi:HD domain-containing protein [Paenibacillus sonchi]|uniref:HD domain-containing protein n=1 Tax=Paenibacillus sonchi TaxID=373687 RepID=UPI0002EF8444|nr:ATP-binding protein [Paenibacillus sonchi]
MYLSDMALMKYLNKKNSLYHGKILELRESVANWLSYIPHTFPHYTRHTVEHSEEIILQISKMLFKDNDQEQAILRLSSAEAFIIMASALLHDTGMVVSDQEKIKILQSEEWNLWVSRSGAKRWNEIMGIREDNSIEISTRNFIADLQTRYLIAEYIRKTHHLKAVDIMTQNHTLLGKFSFDDPSLFRTITDICVAHGLSSYELDDSEKYPERRDIRGEEVNVKFLALLLRIGDLLDMSYDRACPLLMNAACPLPADSLAHWTQYQRITHRLTATDSIEITAKCNTQDEHRFLQDWCQWLVDEMKNTSIIMSKATRHSNWIVPSVSMGTLNSSIKIEPSISATYIPSEWKLELDQDMVFQRLISDVYQSEKDFLRELLQNALDATRCKLIEDLKNKGDDVPTFTNQISEHIREKYPINITLEEIAIQSPLSQEEHLKQLLVIEDNGLGMDTEIIKKYFLQVGRSYYTSEEFQRKFSFKPNSQFGVGFLSVFAVSEHITVETFKPSSFRGEGPISLCLTSPRSYLLTDKGSRKKSGTKISLILKKEFSKNELYSLLNKWCKKIEFPIFLNELGTQSVINSEEVNQFTYEIESLEENKKFVTSVYFIDEKDVFGEIYVTHLNDNNKDDWSQWNWINYQYENSHPIAIKPNSPRNLTCINGIAYSEFEASGPFSFRIDYRGEYLKPNLSRQHMDRENHLDNPVIYNRFIAILNEHLSSTPIDTMNNKWIYINKIINSEPRIIKSFQDTPIIRVFISGKPKLLSPNEISKFNKFYTFSINSYHKKYSINEIQEILNSIKEPVLLDMDLFRIADNIIPYYERAISKITSINENYFHLTLWTTAKATYLRKFINSNDYDYHRFTYSLAKHDNKNIIGLRLFDSRRSRKNREVLVLNLNNILVKWLIKVNSALEERSDFLITNAYNKILELLKTPITIDGYESDILNDHINKWREIKGLPSQFLPPKIIIDKSMFFTSYR